MMILVAVKMLFFDKKPPLPAATATTPVMNNLPSENKHPG
jgi:hypothetical protein